MRAIALTIALLALPLGGCLRLSYDLCAREVPHPECDGSVPVDAGTSDGGELDAGSSDDDAGSSDAGSSEDAGLDAGAELDSGVDDADTVMPDSGALDAASDAG